MGRAKQNSGSMGSTTSVAIIGLGLVNARTVMDAYALYFIPVMMSLRV